MLVCCVLWWHKTTFADEKEPNHHKINHRRNFVCLWSLATTKYTVVDWTLGVRKESKHRVQEECEKMLKTRCVRRNYISGPGSAHTQWWGSLCLVLDWCVRLHSPAVSVVLRELQGFTPERGGRNWCTTAFMLFPDLPDLFSCPSKGCEKKKSCSQTRGSFISLSHRHQFQLSSWLQTGSSEGGKDKLLQVQPLTSLSEAVSFGWIWICFGLKGVLESAGAYFQCSVVIWNLNVNMLFTTVIWKPLSDPPGD